MKLADPILISQIISSLGLTGQEAETKRQELEKLSNDELNKLIANVSSYSPISLGGFTALENQNKFSGNVFQEHFVDNSSTSFSTIQSTQPKEYTRVQQKELDRFLGDFLYNSASSGLQEITAYNNSIGTLNITDRAVNGFKVLTGQQDRIGLQEQMTEEVAEAQKLKKAAYSQPGAFESKIERKFGVPYSHSNVEQLKTASEEFTNYYVGLTSKFYECGKHKMFATLNVGQEREIILSGESQVYADLALKYGMDLNNYNMAFSIGGKYYHDAEYTDTKLEKDYAFYAKLENEMIFNQMTVGLDLFYNLNGDGKLVNNLGVSKYDTYNEYGFNLDANYALNQDAYVGAYFTMSLNDLDNMDVYKDVTEYQFGLKMTSQF